MQAPVLQFVEKDAHEFAEKHTGKDDPDPPVIWQWDVDVRGTQKKRFAAFGTRAMFDYLRGEQQKEDGHVSWYEYILPKKQAVPV